MQITTNPEGRTTLVGKATFTPDEVSQGFEQVYKDNVSRIKIPGFRPGKAPFKIFATHVGIESMKEDFTEIAARQALKEMLSGKTIRVVGSPTFEVDSFEGDGPLNLTIKIFFIPDYELADPSKVAIEVPKFDVTDTDMTKAIDNIRGRYASMAPVDRKAKKGDFVYFKWSVITDGRASDRKKEELVEVGMEDFVKDFDKNLVGVKSGDTKRVMAEISSGQEPVEIEINIGEIKERILPNLDDDFAKTLHVENVEALKDIVKNELLEQAKDAKEEYIESMIAKALLEKTNIELPENLVESSVDDEIEKLARDLSKKNITLEMYMEKRAINEEQLRAELTPKATNQAKLDVILDDYSKENSIEVSKEEIDQEIAAISKAMKDARRPAIDQNDEQVRKNLARIIRRRKTVEYLMGKVQLTEKQ
ncbi:MAG TPA: trigger factor [Caldisericia bacterium]|nr:trigger factor [Caldisericia bacterium]HOR47268.1 trigger factor [Caldisericia bacterium]HOU08365.1 trigger factor [Caldisericia bacterium]HPL89163.1 trigger factor [Caldisericia bacterium]HQG60120.1 trigger factor [Caldisericia bacterium]